MGDIAQELGHSDLQPVFGFAGALAYDDSPVILLDDRRRGHPVERTITTSVIVDQKRPVGLEHQEADGFGEPGGETTRVKDLAAGDEQAHGRRTVLSVSDRTRRRGTSLVLNAVERPWGGCSSCPARSLV